jgi:hypothetical protein
MINAMGSPLIEAYALTASHRGELFAFYSSRYCRVLFDQCLQAPFHFHESLFESAFDRTRVIVQPGCTNSATEFLGLSRTADPAITLKQRKAMISDDRAVFMAVWLDAF